MLSRQIYIYFALYNVFNYIFFVFLLSEFVNIKRCIRTTIIRDRFKSMFACVFVFYSENLRFEPISGDHNTVNFFNVWGEVRGKVQECAPSASTDY